MSPTAKTLLIIGGSVVGVLVIYKVFQMSTASNVAVIRTQTLSTAAPAGTAVAPPSPLTSLLAAIFPSTAKPAVAVNSGGIQMSPNALTSPTGTPTSFVEVAAIHQLI